MKRIPFSRLSLICASLVTGHRSLVTVSRLLTALLALLALSTWSASWSQTPTGYPSRPVRLVPFGPGAPDTIARIVGQQLSLQTEQNFVVDNRPGANGILGAETVARATPDRTRRW
jgi:tripartite-type tricarboxylate transporter receptor subunit TctC